MIWSPGTRPALSASEFFWTREMKMLPCRPTSLPPLKVSPPFGASFGPFSKCTFRMVLPSGGAKDAEDAAPHRDSVFPMLALFVKPMGCLLWQGSTRKGSTFPLMGM